MTNSRAKGAAGEREWAQFLRDHGYEARRGQQFKGGADSPDVVCDDLPRIHWEVKRTEALRLWDALAQAGREGRPFGKTPVVAHRANRREWVVILDATDFLELCDQAFGTGPFNTGDVGP